MDSVENQSTDSDIVYVPVPRERLDAVYRAIAAPPAPPPARRTVAGLHVRRDEVGVTVRGQGHWTESMVVMTAAEVQAYPGAAKLLEMVAERAPRTMEFTEGSEAAGVEKRQLRAELGALSKLTKRLFDRITWPISVRYNGQGEASYSMDPQVAEWWLVALADARRSERG